MLDAIKVEDTDHEVGEKEEYEIEAGARHCRQAQGYLHCGKV
jgi:hypothetical protein